jgi:putative CocE/NonD family hydrolase
MAHQTRDAFWAGHSQRPGPNHVPVLADTGFYDPEARGPFESFRALRRDGAHLLVLGAHDGFPAGKSPFASYRRWFDHYLLGEDNGIDREPAVQLWLGNGSREALLAGKTTRVDARRWPVPGTSWRRLYLRAGKTLGSKPSAAGTQSYPAVISPSSATDPQTTSVTGTALSSLGLTDMRMAEPFSTSWTSAPLTRAINVAGPAALDVFLASTAPDSAIHAVVADVWPDGKAYPVGVGRLKISFPSVDRARSIVDRRGEIVQPYGDYTHPRPAVPGRTREYHVEFWPLGNRFAAGHRIRLYLTGISSFMLPTTPALHTVSFGDPTPSRLLLAVLP